MSRSQEAYDLYVSDQPREVVENDIRKYYRQLHVGEQKKRIWKMKSFEFKVNWHL